MQQNKKKTIRRKWTRQEDDLLISAVKRNVDLNWPVIAQEIPNRTSRQCRERWTTYLRPEIKQTKWTRDEDDKLLSAHNLRNLKWAEIAHLLPGRTPTNIKNRYQKLQGLEAKKTAKINLDDTYFDETHIAINDFDDEFFNFDLWS
jgi:hypothetical protein